MYYFIAMKSFSAIYIYIAILITHNLVCIINSSPCTRRQRELREAESYDLTAISTAPTQPSYILFNIDLGKNQDIAISQCISVPTICCYEKKVRMTILHVGYANANDKFKQVMTGYVASQKLTKNKKKLVEKNNNKILDSDDVLVGIPNQNEALKTKLEDEISVDKKPVVKSKVQHVSEFCVKILSTMEG